MISQPAGAFVCVLLVACCSRWTVFVTASNNDDTTPQCRLYLAPSAIKGGGLGSYTGVDLQPDDIIGPPDIVIHMTDLRIHNQPVDRKNFILFSEYTWAGSDYGGQFEGFDVESLPPGLACTTNGHAGLYNIVTDTPKFVDGGGLHRNTDAGVGAFTNYHGVETRATRTLEAGSELFAHYGDDFFEEREQAQGWYVSLEWHYEKADETVKDFLEFREKHGTGLTGLDNETLQDLWTTILANIHKQSDNAMRLVEAMPRKLTDLDLAAEIGTAAFKVPDRIRSLQWLNSNGYCMDNLRPDRSTLPQAGRGAFATRPLKAGTVIVPFPLVPVPNRDLLRMVEFHRDAKDKQKFFTKGASKTKQLLWNYCLGHRDSSLLLYPYSTMSNLINHNSEKPNAKLQWSSTSSHHQKQWLTDSVEALKSQKKAGLMMELVATRDIQPGEEVLFNYGREWEIAWQRHLQQWKPISDDDEMSAYVSPHELNATELTLRTFSEQQTNPYPANVLNGCYYNPDGIEKDGKVDKQKPDTIRRKWTRNYEEEKEVLYLRRCRIVSRTELIEKDDDSSDDADTTATTTYLYEAVMSSVDDDIPEGRRHVVHDIPRSAITFVNRLYSSDQHLANAFRHEIMILDELFPEAWKDDRKEGQEDFLESFDRDEL